MKSAHFTMMINIIHYTHIAAKEEPLSDYTESERKQFFRQKLLPLVQKYCPEHAIKITTVLVEMNTQKMIELFASDNNELQNKIKSTLEFLGTVLPYYLPDKRKTPKLL